MQIQVEECSYINVRFAGGQAVLRQGLAANELEIVFFHVCPAKRNQEMEGYSYYGSNPGIAEEDYEDIAEELMKEFGLK